MQAHALLSQALTQSHEALYPRHINAVNGLRIQVHDLNVWLLLEHLGDITLQGCR